MQGDPLMMFALMMAGFVFLVLILALEVKTMRRVLRETQLDVIKDRQAVIQHILEQHNSGCPAIRDGRCCDGRD